MSMEHQAVKNTSLLGNEACLYYWRFSSTPGNSGKKKSTLPSVYKTHYYYFGLGLITLDCNLIFSCWSNQ